MANHAEGGMPAVLQGEYTFFPGCLTEKVFIGSGHKRYGTFLQAREYQSLVNQEAAFRFLKSCRRPKARKSLLLNPPCIPEYTHANGECFP